MIDQEIFANSVKADPFPFPSEGDISLGVRSANYQLGPVMLHLNMEPGSYIPAHKHDGVAEVLYIVEGDFTNDGKAYGPGDSLHIKAGNVHGPHSTRNGCKVLVLWTEKTANQTPNLGDFTVAAAAKAA